MRTSLDRAIAAAAGLLVVPAALVDGPWTAIAVLALLAWLVADEIAPYARQVAVVCAVVAVAGPPFDVPGTSGAQVWLAGLVLAATAVAWVPPRHVRGPATAVQAVAVLLVVLDLVGATSGHLLTGLALTCTMTLVDAVVPSRPASEQVLGLAALLGVPLGLLQGLGAAAGTLGATVGTTAALGLVTGVLLAGRARALASTRALDATADALLRVARDGVLAVDASGRIVQANPAAVALLGQDGHSPVGTPIAQVLPMELDNELIDRTDGFTDAGDLVEPGGLPLGARSLTGGVVEVAVASTQIEHPDGPRRLVVLRDVRDRLRNEELLERELAAREQIVQQLTKVDALRTRLLTAASHELRTPLTVIRGTAELLLDRPAIDPDMATSLLQRQLNQSVRLATLVDDLVTADPATSVELRPEPTDVEALVRDAAEVCRAANPGVPIQVSAMPTLAVVDPVAVRRMLGALLDNAARHGQPPVLVQLQTFGGRLRLEVHDSGTGIPDDLRDEVVAPFGRGVVMDSVRPGLGLGLTIVRALASAAGGSLDVVPAARGTLVRIDLPLVAVDDGLGPVVVTDLSAGTRAAASGPTADREDGRPADR